MRIERHYTTDDGSPREEVAYRTTACEIRNPDGSAVFAQKDVEVPASWSQVACDVLAQKYFRKAGIAAQRKPVPEADVPEWLWRSAPDPEAEESARPCRRQAEPGRTLGQGGVSPPRRHLDLLGLEGGLLRQRIGCPRLL